MILFGRQVVQLSQFLPPLLPAPPKAHTHTGTCYGWRPSLCVRVQYTIQNRTTPYTILTVDETGLAELNLVCQVVEDLPHPIMIPHPPSTSCDGSHQQK
jgi:hypothetical protein